MDPLLAIILTVAVLAPLAIIAGMVKESRRAGFQGNRFDPASRAPIVYRNIDGFVRAASRPENQPQAPRFPRLPGADFLVAVNAIDQMVREIEEAERRARR